MKKPMILLICSLFTLHASLAQQYGWTDISANMPELGGFTDVHFIGEEGWVIGGNDKVYYTPDGGETFVIQDLPPQPGNHGITSSVFMKNNLEGYVVTYSGEINKTDNGGTNWSMLYEPGGVINSVHFPPNSDTGYTCGTNGTIWSFDDTSITDISPPDNVSNLQSICFPVDNNDGKVCGQTTIARYKNNSWNNLQLYDATLFYNSIFFINNNKGWCGGTHGTIIHTIDGISWILQTSNTTKNINDVFFINSLEGWAVGTEILLHTVDGGVTWTQELESYTPGKELRAIYFTSPHNGYVVGNDVVLKYGEVSGIGDGVETLAFEIFPNPSASVISIQSVVFSQESATIEITDMQGRKLFEKHLQAGNETVEVNVSNLASGVYCCKLSTDKSSMTIKVIVKK